MKGNIYGVGAIAIATAVLMSGCTTPADQVSNDGLFAGRTLVVQSWGGDLTKAETEAYYAPFEKRTGATVKVVETTAQATAILKQQVDSGNPEWDIVTGFPGETIGLLTQDGLLESLDYSQIPTAEGLAEGAALDTALGYEVETAVVTYSTRDGVKPLKSMKDFFDVEKFPGQRMAPNWGTASMQCEMALLADGVSVDELYPLDIDRCLGVWERVKPSMGVWFTSGSQMAQTLVQDEVDYCMCWDARVQQATKTNPDWTYVFDGGESYFVYAGIAKGSKNADMAHALLDLMSEPEAQASYAAAMKYSPSNPDAIALMPEEVRDLVSTAPKNAALVYFRAADKNDVINAENESVERAWGDFVAR